MVVAQVVAVGEEGLSGILCRCDTQFNAVVVVELVAQVVTVFVAQITVEVTVAVVERNLERSHEQVFSVFGDVAHLRPYAALTFFTDHDIVGKLLARLVVQLGNHLQLAQRPHGAVAVEVLHDRLNLLCRQERQLFQLLTGDLVQIELVDG